MLELKPKRLRVALAQLNYKVGDIEANYAKMRDAVLRAKEMKADIVVFSELALLGYPPQDLLHHDDYIARQHEYLRRLAVLTDPNFGIICGYAEVNANEHGRRLYNSAAFCLSGHIKASSRKGLLPQYDVFDEARYFEPSTALELFAIRGIVFGISICEDAWSAQNSWEMPSYAYDPVARQSARGVRVLFNISASPYARGKVAFRQQLLSGHAKKHQKPVVFVNQVGANDELIFDGSSAVYEADGSPLCQMKAFEEDLRVVELWVGGRPPKVPPVEPQLCEPVDELEMIRRALVMGVRDYVHKSGFRGALIGLSGGIDSALTTYLAVEALGAQNIKTVGLPSRYSSEHSIEDSKQLAKNLGIDFDIISIEPMFEAYLAQLSKPFEGYEDDVTEENIQSRIRGGILMAMSNKFNKLVLTTGNKSELAVGYCTLYGDMCGALAVIGDIPKTMVFDLCRHINALHGREIIPQNIIDKPPSAELRPDQLDQDSLPPYDVLDAILEAYMEENLSAEAIVERGYDADTVGRIIGLLHRSEYKRKQAAPALKITAKAFGTGWRYPIVARYRT